MCNMYVQVKIIRDDIIRNVTLILYYNITNYL